MFEMLNETGVGDLTTLSASPEVDTTKGEVPTAQKTSTSRSTLPFRRSTSDSSNPPSMHVPHHETESSSTTIASHDDTRSPTHRMPANSPSTERSSSPPPPPISTREAFNRAVSLSKKLTGSNIPTHVNDSGDLMLDMTGYKSSEDEALRAEVVARKVLAEELEGNYDIGALIGADEHGNLWIYSSEEAKEAAARKIGLKSLATGSVVSDAVSDPGYHSDEDRSRSSPAEPSKHQRTQSDLVQRGIVTPPQTPLAEIPSGGDPNRNYAKTLRLTSDQLKAMNLKPGANTMSFSVNRAICQAHMFYWTHDVPIVISDIDGTITK